MLPFNPLEIMRRMGIDPDDPKLRAIVERMQMNVQDLDGIAVMGSDRTPEEQVELRRLIRERAASIPEEMRSKAETLIPLLAKLDAFDMIAHLALPHLMHNLVGEIKDDLPAIPPAVAEYVALLYLRSAYPLDGLDPTDHEQSLSSEAKAIIDGIFADAALLTLFTGHEGPSDSPEEIDHFRVAMSGYELQVRNSAYTCHLDTVLLDIFAPFDADLIAGIGFTMREAIRLSNATIILMRQRLTLRFRLANEEIERAVRDIRSYRRNGQMDDDGHLQLARKVSSVPTNKLTTVVRRFLLSWVYRKLGETLSFTAKDLAEAAEVDELHALTFLQFFAIKFGEVSDPNLLVPSPVHPLKDAPYLVNLERFLCPSPLLVDWALRPGCESFVKKDGARWGRYRTHRHDAVVAQAVGVFEKVMPEGLVDTHLDYRGSDGVKYELDGLIRFANVLFLLEVKAGTLNEAARSGDPRNIVGGLKSLVGRAHDQANRALTAVNGPAGATFVRKDGSSFSIQRRTFRHVILCEVSLEPLGHVASLMRTTRHLGLFDKGEIGWQLSIYDLAVLGDVFTFPAMLPHYAIRRMEVIDNDILGPFDEIGLVGFYLKHGLSLRKPVVDGRPVNLSLLDYQFVVDEAYRTGAFDAKRVANRWSDGYLQWLQAFQSSGFVNWLSAALPFMDLGREDQAKFLADLRTAKLRARRDRITVDFTMFAEVGGWSITVIIAGDAEHGQMGIDWFRSHLPESVDGARWLGVVASPEENHEIKLLQVGA